MKVTNESIPAALWDHRVAELDAVWETLKIPPNLDIIQLKRGLLCSEFVMLHAHRNPGFIEALVETEEIVAAYTHETLSKHLDEQLAEIGSEQDLKRLLRKFRNHHQARIAWRDLAGLADVTTILHEISDLADVLIDRALQYLYEWQCRDWGVPRNKRGEQQRLFVLGMGKLGGRELNFSSDVDLIFVYPNKGETDHETRPRDNEQFFTQIGKKLIATLDEKSADGFVYRVDMRLRPYGTAGALVSHASAFEGYYQAQGRSWERYAMIKARVVAGDKAAGERVLQALRPFVYRRYLDFGAFESLREMKGMIEQQVEKSGMDDNIKIGWGGIREIEFIGQVFQLVYGGQESDLQIRPIQEVLKRLAAMAMLPTQVVDELLAAYRFLRKAENSIQALADRQDHELPEDELARIRISTAMGFADWPTFYQACNEHRQRVHEHFSQLISDQTEQSDDGDMLRELQQVWLGGVTDEVADTLLENVGFKQATGAQEVLEKFRDSYAFKLLSDQGVSRLNRLMPEVLQKTGEMENPDDTLSRLMNLFAAIVSRSCYLALLAENAAAVTQLIKLCSASPWIAEFLSQHAALLDELLDPSALYRPLSKTELQQELTQRLEGIAATDLEAQMEVLRNFSQTNVLRVAAADVVADYPVMKVSDRLTELAEICVQATLDMAWQQMLERHGKPTCMVDGVRDYPGMVIVAYGKLGGIELGYGSDLDLVFIHNSRGEQQQTDGDRSIDNATFFVRLGQKVIHLLSTRTPSGVLYEIDMRLRPSGNSGLLVASETSFDDYQHTQAWTWEHQAIVRARAVAGDERVAKVFHAVRHDVLTKERDNSVLRDEIRDMRNRMRQELEDKDPQIFDLKQARGGIADIEFMVQYGVLSLAHAVPTLTTYTDNVRLLEQLAETGWLPKDQADFLTEAYKQYRARGHRLTLQGKSSKIAADDMQETRKQVSAIWQHLMQDK